MDLLYHELIHCHRSRSAIKPVMILSCICTDEVWMICGNSQSLAHLHMIVLHQLHCVKHVGNDVLPGVILTKFFVQADNEVATTSTVVHKLRVWILQLRHRDLCDHLLNQSNRSKDLLCLLDTLIGSFNIRPVLLVVAVLRGH